MANSYSLFWLFVHFVSYILMGFTVYLQAKALSYDYTKVDFKLLWGTKRGASPDSSKVRYFKKETMRKSL